MTDTEVRPADSVLFKDFCTVLEGLSKWKKQRQKQDRILEEFINDFRLQAAAVTTQKNVTFFPILRLLLPNCERVRSAYNLKEKKLGQLLVKVLAIKKESPDGKKLLNFKSVNNNSQDNDFAGVAYFVLKNRVAQRDGSLTIAKVNEMLDKIAAADVGNKGPTLEEAFRFVIDNSSAEQMKWFFRIVLKDLKLRMGKYRTLSAFHPDAPEYYDNCRNLAKVCEELEDGNTRSSELGVQMFDAISPMLSERMDVTHVGQLSPHGTYSIENKFDGERFQIHMKDGIFKYFSRRGFPFTDTYGKTYESGLLTPKLKDCFSPNITSFIMDGEMMGWHKQDQCFIRKGRNFDVKKLTGNSEISPCFCAYDLLYYNGKPLVGTPEKGGEPLSHRLVTLDLMFTDVPGVILHSKVQHVKHSTDILAALNKADDDDEEGIVVKDTESYYIANRRNAGWYKIKPEYTGSAMEDLDLVIIGAENAKYKKHGPAMRSFYVAFADVAQPGSAPHRWVCLSRVATKYAMREQICAELEKHWVPAKREPPPSCLNFHKQKPDFWILPEHSTVLQVRATSLIRSTDSGAAYTLQHPRVVRLRDDKPVQDALTSDEFNKLVANKGSVVKLSTKHINEDQIAEPATKVRKKRTTKEVKVPEHLRTKVSSSDVEVTSRALFGKEICILSDDEDCKKEELVRIVLSHGGKYVENDGPNTWCAIAGKRIYSLQRTIAAQAMDILTTSWLRQLPPSETPCVLRPLDFHATSKKTEMDFRRSYDRFGDSYTEPLDEEVLKKIFRKMNKEPEIHLTIQEMLKIDEELFEDNNPFSYLRACFIHHPNPESVQAIKAKLYGATMCGLNSSNLTHAVVTPGPLIEDTENMKKTENVFVVSDDWLEECFLEVKLVPETKYYINLFNK